MLISVICGRFIPDCRSDYLRIRAAENTYNGGTYCGRYIPQYMMFKAPVNLYFKTDASGTSIGFEISYKKYGKQFSYSISLWTSMSLVIIYFLILFTT